MTHPTRRHALLTGTAAFAALAAPRARAQAAWPARPVFLVVPFPPGGGTDIPNLYGDAVGAFLRQEIKRWTEVVKNSGAKLD